MVEPDPTLVPTRSCLSCRFGPGPSPPVTGPSRNHPSNEAEGRASRRPFRAPVQRYYDVNRHTIAGRAVADCDVIAAASARGTGARSQWVQKAGSDPLPAATIDPDQSRGAAGNLQLPANRELDREDDARPFAVDCSGRLGARRSAAIK